MRPRLRRAIAFAGGAFLTASAVCLASDSALRAAPLVTARLHLSLPRIALDAPAPAPAPSASPRPRRALLGQGPIVLKGDGTYQLGLNRSSRNGLAGGTDNYATALSMVAERRTEQTSTSVSTAFGYGAGTLAAGSLIVAYNTPRYGLSYGQVTGPSESQLQIGGLARGVSLAIPIRNGDISYLASSAQQTDQITYRIYGVRRDWNAFGGFLAAAQYFAGAEQGGGHQSLTDIGFRRYGAVLSTDSEVALSSTHGMGGVTDGAKLATAFHADLQGKTAFATLGLRFDPAGFQTLSGAMDGGFQGDLTLRKHSERFGDVDLDLGHTDAILDGDVQHDNRATFSGGRSWQNVSLQFVGGLDGTHSASAGTSLQRTAALTMTESVRGLSLFETLQATSSSAATGLVAQRQLALGASRQLFGGSLSYQFARSNVGGGDSSGDALSQSFSYRRPLGRKLDVQVTESVQTSANNGIPTRVIDTSLSLVRRLSSVVALQVSADMFRQTGLGGGSGSSLQASLVGPFGFGTPRSTGRANPNVPAVIRGVVTYSTSSTPFAYNAPTLKGYNNALVILDGKITQRTDANGEFEFRFVAQGAHTIRIDPATIQPGLIADREYQTLQVLGGQTSTIQFTIGNFAGVGGTVAVTDANGVKRGLGSVGIAIDGIQAVTTSPDGHYSIGRLSPGAHTVEIVEATVPSTVAFVSDKKKTVTVTPGASTPLNFVATPLGSIAGNVLAPGDGGFGQLGGLKNVYVLAEPGEHAVITDDDGGFILDNMPPGSYTLSVDPDTVPDGLSVLSGPEGTVALAGGASISGITFKLGAGAKQVVYTFSDGRRQPIQVTTEPSVVPPGGLLRVVARTGAKDVKSLAVESDVFGGFPLRFDPKLGLWAGSVLVPSLAKGDYALTVTAHRKDVTDATSLVPVDPAIPLFALRLSPRNAEGGRSIRVTLKTAAPVSEGDALLFEDGYKVLLPKPSGRVFGFDMRLWRKGLPYSATLVTKRGQTYPISLR